MDAGAPVRRRAPMSHWPSGWPVSHRRASTRGGSLRLLSQPGFDLPCFFPRSPPSFPKGYWKIQVPMP